MSWSKEQMADQVVKLFTPGSSVNLGIGMPTMVASRITPEMDIMIHSENGVLGVKGRPAKDEVSPTLINAGKETISIKPGASFFDSALSFGMIRGGHIDFCVLGGMEVDAKGNLANWMVPGKKVTGMGGAMDLVNGAKQVIIMMSHADKEGNVKLVEQCTLPLTGVGVVDLVVTERGVFKPNGKGFDTLVSAG
ncbi:MAG: succinyl-CoA--3-ketoacid-CoA transferase [Halobacteriovorax sp.]|nr:succinyl-CoA--3-ketoacid-CoA transferase [Halobacteriovorax sp.]